MKFFNVIVLHPSPIQTILSALDLHQIHRFQKNSNPGHGLRGSPLITAGWEFHPAPKDIY